MIVALSLLTPALAQHSVEITGVEAELGDLWLKGTANTSETEVWLNGQNWPLDNALYPLGPKEFSVRVSEIAPGLEQHQSAMHSVRADLKPQGIPAASDHYTWYDRTEIGAPANPVLWRPEASSLRVTEAALADVNTISEAILREDLTAFSSVGVQTQTADAATCTTTSEGTEICLQKVQGQFQGAPCVGLGNTGLQLGDVDLGDAEVGIGVDLNLITPSYVKVCFENWEVLYTRDFTDIMPAAGTNVLTFDSKVDRVETEVNLGSARLAGDILVEAKVELDLNGLAGIGIVPSPDFEVFDIDIWCSADASVDSMNLIADIELEPDSTSGGVDARQVLDMANITVTNPTFEMGDVCAAMPLQNHVAPAVGQEFTRIFYDMFTLPAYFIDAKTDDPMIPTLVEDLFAQIPMAGIVPAGPVDLEWSATMTEITERPQGITLIQDVQVRAASFDPEVDLVGPSGFYAPHDFSPTHTNGADLEATLSTSIMSKALYEAHQAGAFHDRMTLRTDLSQIGFDTSGLADTVLTPEFLANLFEGVDLVIPAGMELEIHAGPKLAPIIVAEDPQSGLQRDLHASVFGYELKLVESSTGAVWATAVGDYKSRLRLEVDANGGLQVFVEDTQFQMDMVDPDGTLHALAGPQVGTVYLLELQVEEHIREMLQVQLEAIPFGSLSLDDRFGLAQQLEFTAEAADTIQQRETLKMNVEIQ